MLRDALHGVRALVIGERADSYGSGGGNVAHEVKSTLKDDPDNRTVCLSRIYGLGGRDFYVEDAEALFRLAIEAAGQRRRRRRCSTTTASSRAIPSGRPGGPGCRRSPGRRCPASST